MRTPGAAWIASLAVLTACAGSGGGGGGGGGGGKKPPATCTKPPQATISFSRDIQPIFDRSCALPACHVPGTLGGNLDLTAGKAYGNIVNVKSF